MNITQHRKRHVDLPILVIMHLIPFLCFSTMLYIYLLQFAILAMNNAATVKKKVSTLKIVYHNNMQNIVIFHRVIEASP